MTRKREGRFPFLESCGNLNAEKQRRREAEMFYCLRRSAWEVFAGARAARPPTLRPLPTGAASPVCNFPEESPTALPWKFTEKPQIGLKYRQKAFSKPFSVVARQRIVPYTLYTFNTAKLSASLPLCFSAPLR